MCVCKNIKKINMITFTGLIALVAGILIIMRGIRLIKESIKESREQDKYRFEHRTSGGTITFNNYEDSEAFQRKVNKTYNKRTWGDLLMGLGVLLIILAILFFYFGDFTR